MVYVSVDGGATKTMAVCYDSDGKILGMAANGPSNFRNIGVENAKKHITDAVMNSIVRAGVEFKDIDKITFALAGVKDSLKSTEMINNFVRELNFRQPYSLLNDGEAGFNCRFFNEDGIIAAAGTGMISYGRLKNRFDRSSGWGWLIGDEGGAFYIGRRAIQEAAKLADGRSRSSSLLLTSVEDFFGVKEPRQLVNEVYSNPINVRRIAMLARNVSSLANFGDEAAVVLIREAATEAAECVLAIKRTHGAEREPVSGYGGVFRAGKLYWDMMKDVITDEFPETKFKDPLFGYHAVLGSVYLTLDEAGSKGFSTEEILKDFDSKIEKLPLDEREQYLLLP